MRVPVRLQRASSLATMLTEGQLYREAPTLSPLSGSSLQSFPLASIVMNNNESELRWADGELAVVAAGNSSLPLPLANST